MLLTGLTVMLLLAMSAFFSMAETALTSVSRPKILGLSQEGDRRALIVKSLLEKQDRLISTLLLGNNLINILASAITTEFMLDMFGKKGIAFATGAMTVLVLVFAEVLPKSYALNQSDKVSLRIAPVVRVLYWLLLPPNLIISWIVRRIAKLFSVDFGSIAYAISAEELRGAIEMHRSEDADSEIKNERKMLHSVLDLSNLTVQKVMTHRKNIEMLDSALSIDDMISKALASAYTRIPLYQDQPENVVGLLHTPLLARQMHHAHKDNAAIDISASISEPWFIPSTTNLLEQLQAFRERSAQFALVVDEYGSLLGLVTREDILEEIVGNMDAPAFSGSESKASPVQPQSVVVGGGTTIRELNREYDWDLPDESYATVAGLVLYEARLLPEAGQSFIFYNFRFDVLERQRNQITHVRVTKLDTAEPTE